MFEIFSCLPGTERIHRPHRSKVRKSEKSHDEVARFEPNFHQSEQARSGRADNAQLHRQETGPPPSRRASIDSHRSLRTTRSSREALRDVEDQLLNWLNARRITFDQSNTAATPLLNEVFASHASLWHSRKALEDKLRLKDNEIQGYESEVTANEQELSRLDGQKIAAEREVSRLGQVVNGYEAQLQFERAETRRLVTTHTNEVDTLKASLGEYKKQHKELISELTSYRWPFQNN